MSQYSNLGALAAIQLINLGLSVNILIVGYLHHPQVRHFNDVARELGHTAVLLAPEQMDRWRWDETGVYCADVDLNVEEIDAAYISQRPAIFPTKDCFDRAASRSLNWEDWYYLYFRQRDRYDSLMSFLFYLEHIGKPMFNPQSRILFSEQKPYQLNILKRAGCVLPDTLMTNDPDAAKAFIEKQQQVIAKPVADKLTALQLQKVKTSPVIFQKRVFGADIRATLIDGEFVSIAKILVPEGTLDFRENKHYQCGQIAYENAELPESTKESCRKAADTLGFRFAGIDIKQTSDGGHFLLEFNSSANYLDVEKKLGHAITKRLILAIEKSVMRS